jgi:hypothetical protein
LNKRYHHKRVEWVAEFAALKRFLMGNLVLSLSDTLQVAPKKIMKCCLEATKMMPLTCRECKYIYTEPLAALSEAALSEAARLSVGKASTLSEKVVRTEPESSG